MQNKQKSSNLTTSKTYASDRVALKYGDKKNLSKENLSNIRIIKKNLVYVIGLTKDMANKNVRETDLKNIRY